MFSVHSDRIGIHEDANTPAIKPFRLGYVEAPDQEGVRLARLQVRLAEKDQLLYELLSCAQEMLMLDDSQKEEELRYMEALLTDHYLGQQQAPASSESEEEFVVTRRVSAVSVMAKNRRGARGLEVDCEAVHA